MQKTALITGITGQDGAYLARLLLEQDYRVFGLVRRTSSPIFWRIESILPRITLLEGDVLDSASITEVLNIARPDEIYHLAAQSHVMTSFKAPIATAEATALGTTRLLECIRQLALDVKFYQASSSEMFGNAPAPQNEATPFAPRSPYAIAKLHSYWSVVNAREAYGLFACNGILFNHESPLRGELFVSRKITRAAARIAEGLQDMLELGNLDAQRDWGHAKDYVRAMHLMLQQNEPQDYVIASGQTRSVREFANAAFAHVGIEISWQDGNDNEVGVVKGKTVIRIDPSLKRPAEVHQLRGDAAKAKAQLGWQPHISFEALVQEMMEYDLALAKHEKNL